VRVIGAVTDVTERRRADERVRTVAEATNDGIWTWEAGTGEGWWSDKYAALLGYEPTELSPTHEQWMRLVHPDDRERVARSNAAWLAGPAPRWDEEYRMVRKDGGVLTIRDRGQMVRDAAGQPRTAVGALTDVTQQRKIELQFRQAQRLEAVGRLAGGVAHDFNNILSAILGYGQILKEDIAAGTPRGADLEEILRAAGRARDLTRQLLAFSRQQVLDLRVLEVNGVVEGVRNMLGRLLGEDVDLALRLDPAAGCLKADAGQLEQVIMNLAVNARDAMPGGGRLTIETAAVDLDAAYAQAHEPLAPGPYVLLAVSDTGCGMTADVKARVFEPFFTTKGPHQGTGLGLSTVYGIVKQSGGFIWVYSEPGQGTTFKIYLPRVAERAAPAPAPHAPAPVGGRETILLVEDDAAVRRSTTQLLERMGYTVLAAARGDAALAIVSGSSRAIDLLLSDVVLPDLSGPQLARLLDGLRPGIRVLFMSGYADAAIVRHGILDAGASFLQKPAMPDALARKIREVLDTQEAASSKQ
jgi:PAS domain S-box-containing protein